MHIPLGGDPWIGRTVVFVCLLVVAGLLMAGGHDVATALLVAAAVLGIAAEAVGRALRSGEEAR
jgi:hypothetical protein